MTRETELIAWHFLATNYQGKPVMRDGTSLRLRKWYRHRGEIELCASGYHASLRAIDALTYAPGGYVTLVRIRGEVQHESDKLVARERMAIAGADCADELREFSRWCALQVLHLWEAPEVVRRYLETGDESLRPAVRAAAAKVKSATVAEAKVKSAAVAASCGAAAARAAVSTATAWEAAARATEAATDAGWWAAETATWVSAAAFLDRANAELEQRLRALLEGDEG